MNLTPTILIFLIMMLIVVLGMIVFFRLAVQNLARVFAIFLPFNVQVFASVSHMALDNAKNHDAIKKLLHDLKKQAKISHAPQVSSIYLNHKGAVRLFDVHYVYRFGVATLCLTDVTDIEILQNKLSSRIGAEHQVFNNLNIGINILDESGRLLFCNAPQNKIWGVPDITAGIALDDLLQTLKNNKTVPKTLESDDFIASEQKLLNNLTEPTTQILYLPDGRIIQRISTPYPDGGIFQSSEDITEITKLEQDIRGLLSVYRNTLDNIQEGIAVFNDKGFLQLSNPAFTQIWHLKTNFVNSAPHYEVLLEKTLHLFGRDVEINHFKNRIGKLIEKKRGLETRIHLKSGAVIRMAALPISEQRLLLIFRDITLQEQYRILPDAREKQIA
ncbi:MAG: PAS-domain containing protein [Alphaproteobacteria bacterium]|nr:PAS-domain containing protein [Alphaproteobacteria bacterium]